MDKPSLAIFFGAGAEVCYGLPSGGKFALDLFRTSVETDRETFKEQLQAVDATSIYATKWLPDNYASKRIHVFGKGEFEGLIASSLEYRRHDILRYLDDFDSHVRSLLNRLPISDDNIRRSFHNDLGVEIGSFSYGQVVRLNSRLASRVNLFDSEYFSAFLKLLEVNSGHKDLKRIVRAFLELLVGSYGQELISRLNEELFEAAPESLTVFDDLSGIFSLNYRTAGQTGMEVVLEGEEIVAPNNTAAAVSMFSYLGRQILEDLYAQALDYQALIDSHFRYLYNPRAEWAKFTRISIFLHTARRYIITKGSVEQDKLASGPGYYHDLTALTDLFNISAIGTTNYNSFAHDVLTRTGIDIPVFHLNGSVNEYYDPYANAILMNLTEEELNALGHIVVPFIFTQSGIKPLTSIAMSRRYVEMYDKFSQVDVICVVGYRFGSDDGHINGMLRALVENEGKQLFIMHHGSGDTATLRREYQSKLRLTSASKLTIIPINDDRLSDEVLWYEKLYREYVEYTQEPALQS